MALVLFIVIGCSSIFLFFIGEVLIRLSLAVVTVENGSMSPTLLPGDRVLVVRHWPRRWLRKGHIVLIKPRNAQPAGSRLFERTPYIKRIIGLGGETLTLLHNSSVAPDTPRQHADRRPSERTWHIPKGHLFVRGDNGPASSDSLSWGPIPEQHVLGVALMRLPRKTPAPSTQREDRHGLPVGNLAPSFIAQTLSGEVVTLSAYSGRLVIFLFLLPKAILTYAPFVPQAAKAGITLVFVSVAEWGVTRAFVEQSNIKAPLLVAPPAHNSFLNDYGFSGTPAFCLINEQGKVEACGHPSMQWESWKALVESWSGCERSVSGKNSR